MKSDKQIAIRIPAELEAALERRAARDGITRAAAARDALIRGLALDLSAKERRAILGALAALSWGWER